MSSFLWPNDDGWPYPDAAGETADLDGGPDDDTLCLLTTSPRLFAGLEPLEREVILSRYGLDGRVSRSMKQLHTELGVSRADLRDALGSGLAKLRTELA